jgi:hypothetical protein
VPKQTAHKHAKPLPSLKTRLAAMSAAFGKPEKKEEARARIHVVSRRGIDGHVAPLVLRTVTDLGQHWNLVGFQSELPPFPLIYKASCRTAISRTGWTLSFLITWTIVGRHHPFVFLPLSSASTSHSFVCDSTTMPRKPLILSELL